MKSKVAAGMHCLAKTFSTFSVYVFVLLMFGHRCYIEIDTMPSPVGPLHAKGSGLSDSGNCNPKLISGLNSPTFGWTLAEPLPSVCTVLTSPGCALRMKQALQKYRRCAIAGDALMIRLRCKIGFEAIFISDQCSHHGTAAWLPFLGFCY